VTMGPTRDEGRRNGGDVARATRDEGQRDKAKATRRRATRDEGASRRACGWERRRVVNE
jgi:hypothetical protein